MLSIFSGQAAVTEIFGNRIPAFPAEFEFNSPRNCIQFGNEIAVASDAFNGTLVTSLLLLYEYALSLPVCFDHDRRLLIDDCHGANSVRHGESVQWRTEHDTAVTFSDHE